MPADLLSDSLFYSNLHAPALGGTTGARARALRRLRSVPGPPRAVSRLEPRRPELSGVGARAAGRALDAHRLVASPTRSACAWTAAARVRRFVEALALGQKIVHFREASTLSAPSEARSSLSALYGERAVAAASPVEVVDEAVLSGRTPTTKQARHRRDSSGRGGF